MCGFVTALGIYIFIPFSIHSLSSTNILFHLWAVMMMGAMGTMVGIWADKWDQQQGITNFISFTTYIFIRYILFNFKITRNCGKNLPNFNPFFYNIDGFQIRISWVSQIVHYL